MRFVFGVAGVPPEFYEHVHARQQQIVRDNSEFWGRPLSGNVYTDPYAVSFLKYFANLVRNDHHDRLADTCFSVIYVQRDEISTQRFRDQLFPAILALSVAWEPTTDTRKQARAESANALIAAVAERIRVAKSGLSALSAEVRDRSNRTPLLLPIKNFRSESLVPMLTGVQEGISGAKNPGSFLRNAAGQFEMDHRAEQDQDHLYQFRDDRRIAFKAPGRACHAFARPSLEHPDMCILSGRRRLGAPYNRAFHYDCLKKQNRLLTGDFYGCHEQAAHRLGNPHLNIAPNDFVRG